MLVVVGCACCDLIYSCACWWEWSHGVYRDCGSAWSCVVECLEFSLVSVVRHLCVHVLCRGGACGCMG